MAKFDLDAFFSNIEGKTWSLGSAFKRADALPLDLYSVWESKEDAENYAQTHATAYPGQILVVVETEGEAEVIKLYYIDENKDLQEVGSATLGDGASITLDEETKTLSIKGFDKAGFAATADEAVVADKAYFTVDTDGNYTVVAEVAEDANPKELGYYERIAVKLIKDTSGNLAWATDDAVQIQGNIAALEGTVKTHGESIADHEERIGDLEEGLKALEKTHTDDKAAIDGEIERLDGEVERLDGRIDDVEDAVEALEKKHGEDLEGVNDRITSLGTVFNFVGSLTVLEFAATTDGGNDNIIDADAVTPGENGRAYRAGDVILVDGKQEYVVVATEAGLIWEPFGDPAGVAGIEGRLVTAEGKIKTLEDITIPGLEDAIRDNAEAIGSKGEGDVASTGLYLYAEQKADTALEGAKSYADGEIESAINTLSGEVDGKFETVNGAIDDINKELDGEGETAGIKSRLTTVEGKATTNATDIDNIEKVINGDGEDAGLAARLTAVEGKATTNATDIDNLEKELNGDGTNAGIKARLTSVETNKANKTDVENTYATKEALSAGLGGKEDKSTVEALTTRVSNVETKASGNETAIGSINGILGTEESENGLIKDVRTLQGAVSKNSGDISSLGSQVSQMSNKLSGVDALANKASSEAQAAHGAANLAQSIADQAASTANSAKSLAEGNLIKILNLTNTTIPEIEGNISTLQNDVSDAMERANDAYDLAEAALPASGGTMSGEIAMGDNKITGLKAPTADTDAVNKKYVDDTKASLISSVDGTTITEDASTHDTIKGSKKYTDEKIATVNESIEEISNKLVDLTTVMNFVGKSTTDPSTGTVTIDGAVITPDLGDVVVYEAFEYVYTGETSGWEIFGNVTADESRFDAIEKAIGVKDESGNLVAGAVGTLLKDVDDLQILTNGLKSTSDGYATRFTNVENRTTALEKEIDGATETSEGGEVTFESIKTRLTKVETTANAAATKTALEAEVERATGRENEIAKSVTDNKTAQDEINEGFEADIDAITNDVTGLLAWGTF